MAEAPTSDDKTVSNEATDDLKIVVEGEEEAGKADEKLAKKTDDDDDDAEGRPERTEEERERIREARRIERRERAKNRAIRREEAAYEIRTLEQQNRELAERLARLEGRTLEQDAARIDERLARTLQERDQAERVYADAITKGDGQLAAKAMRVRDEAVAQARELQSVKARVSAPERPQQAGPDPVVARFAQEWAEDNTWYRPDGSDPDSNIVLAIDQALAAEGFDPRTEDYWDELDARASRALPHRYKAAKPAAKRGPPTGGREGTVSAAAAKTFVVSKERRDAMIQAGTWDDPVKRKKQILAYAEYDKNNSRR